MLPIRNISYLLPMCCSFWEKCKNSPKTGMGCSTPLRIQNLVGLLKTICHLSIIKHFLHQFCAWAVLFIETMDLFTRALEIWHCRTVTKQLLICLLLLLFVIYIGLFFELLWKGSWHFWAWCCKSQYFWVHIFLLVEDLVSLTIPGSVKFTGLDYAFFEWESDENVLKSTCMLLIFLMQIDSQKLKIKKKISVCKID